MHFSKKNNKVKAVFVLVGTRKDKTIHLQSLTAIAQIIYNQKFENLWLLAKDKNNIKDILLLSKRRRLIQPLNPVIYEIAAVKLLRTKIQSPVYYVFLYTSIQGLILLVRSTVKCFVDFYGCIKLVNYSLFFITGRFKSLLTVIASVKLTHF
ncbi:MAG: PTS sugar transporter subunit IIA [bacterium]|nr:PTS sugar transporter subunit IIA [bacterium]